MKTIHGPIGTRDAEGEQASLVVETHGLTKWYGKRSMAVEDLSMTVRQGEVYGFLVLSQHCFDTDEKLVYSGYHSW